MRIHATTDSQRWAEEEFRERVIKRLVAAVMGVIMLVITMMYIVAVMNNRFGSFTISVNKYHQLTYGLSLSETSDFAKPTAQLDCHASEEITNIDGRTLDMSQIGINDGVDSGANYLCYTFYCRNAGEEFLSFESSIVIANMTMGVEKAVRIRVVRIDPDGTRNVADYARAAYIDEKTGDVIPEEGTTPFYSKNIVTRRVADGFAPGETIKYTVVVWLEGPDPDCVDDIVGGEFKIDFKFSVIGHSYTE